MRRWRRPTDSTVALMLRSRSTFCCASPCLLQGLRRTKERCTHRRQVSAGCVPVTICSTPNAHHQDQTVMQIVAHILNAFTQEWLGGHLSKAMERQLLPLLLRAESPDRAPMQLAVRPVCQVREHQAILAHAIHSISASGRQVKPMNCNVPSYAACALSCAATTSGPVVPQLRLASSCKGMGGLTLSTAASWPPAPPSSRRQWPQSAVPVQGRWLQRPGRFVVRSICYIMPVRPDAIVKLASSVDVLTDSCAAEARASGCRAGSGCGT